MALTSDCLFDSGLENIPLPSGYTVPTTAITQTSPVSLGPYTYSMAHSSAVSTTQTLGLNALVAAFETWLSGTFIPTTLGVDVAGNTVTAIATITKIVLGTAPADIYLNNATATVEITFTLTLEVS